MPDYRNTLHQAWIPARLELNQDGLAKGRQRLRPESIQFRLRLRKSGVDIKLTGERDRDRDFFQAGKLAGVFEKYRDDNDLVWHYHHETVKHGSALKGRAQLLSRNLHDAIRHIDGGESPETA